MVIPIIGTGTDERRWLDWPAVGGWPALRLPPGQVPLVIAPHPDDELLGIGGLLALTGAAEVVAVTDGEGSHPDSRVHSPHVLAEIRRHETGEALRRLGLGSPVVHRLRHPDGGIDEDALTDQLRGIVTPGRVCLATWRGDGHPDHEAVGRAAANACAARGAPLLEYPIWAWHWGAPDDERIPWDRARRIDLPAAVQRAKAHAIAAFRSQIAPLGPAPEDAAILPPHVLARFERPFEVIFE